MPTEIACDAALKNRRYDSDKMLHIDRTPISKATVNPYYGREIPKSEELGLDPDWVYYLLRDPGELAKSASSFKNKQLMFKHIAVNADDPKQEYIAGTIGSNVDFEAPYLMADMCIWDADAIAGVETETVQELSSSYSYRADMTPGMYEGQRYDGVMRDIQGNHVALVKAGRAGSDVKAADSKLETKMTETKFGKALYAILCAASPKLAQDAALKPLVIGLTRKKCDIASLEPKLLAMDAELRKPETLAAMQAAKDAESEEESEEEKKEREKKEKEAKDKKAKDGKTAKDLSFEEWAKEEEGEGAHKGKDGEEESMEEKKKRYEREKRRADDSEEESEEERKERIEKRAKDKKAKDCSAKDSEEAEKKKAEDGMKHAMDEFKADLRAADEARRAVRPVVGDVLAQDSADEIYGFALDQMKVDRAGVTGVPALRALFNLAQQASKPAVRQAFDAVSVEDKFPGAARSIQVM
jgi:hypothetical protein